MASAGIQFNGKLLQCDGRRRPGECTDIFGLAELLLVSIALAFKFDGLNG